MVNIPGIAMQPEDYLQREVRRQRLWYVAQALVFIVLGILAFFLPGEIAVSLEMVLGAILLASGILQLVFSRISRMHWWSALPSCLSIVVGAMMVWRPLAGLLAIVTLLGAFLLIEAVFELFLAFQFRPRRNWGWMILSGAITFIMATLLLGWPGLGVLYIGWMVALNLILYGLSLLVLAV